jgi:beta-lactamase superfamily II metal-dependent hydrolase
MALRKKKAVKITMYNVGFGDCFVLRFPTSDGVKRVLVDCGVHPSGPGPLSIDAMARQIVGDIKAETKKKTAHIDVVVATHRHADHVSGFRSDVWDEVTVGEVWLPWTENPRDAEATRIRETQSKVAKKLSMVALPAAKKLAENALTNAEAMHTLHKGFAGSPARHFLPDKKDRQRSFTTEVLPGVDVHVMGPSRDPKVVKDMDPPPGHSYLRVSNASSDDERVEPFRPMWTVTADELPAPPYNAEHLLLDPSTIAALKKLDDVDALAIARSLEASVNGTSLMIMFNVGRAHLLFTGDAQWGTWNAAMSDPEWRELLERTTFLKVGHHGSHNATPTDFVRLLPKDTLKAAMVCTRQETRDWDIPREPLLDALKRKTPNVARSDRPPRSTSKAFKVRRRADVRNFSIDYEAPI